MDQVTDAPMAGFWDDSIVSPLTPDYYHQRPKHYFLKSSPNIRSPFMYMIPSDRFNNYPYYSAGNYQLTNIDASNFQPVSVLKVIID